MEIIPPGALAAEALPASRTVTDENGQFTFTIPEALDGVEVKLESGKSTVTIEQGNGVH